MKPVYLDYNATTPIDARVLAAMLPYLRDEFGNPSSAHALGRRAHDAVEAARAEVAALIGASAGEIIFTSGGTEASNIAIRGAVAAGNGRRAVVTTAVEHPATDACCTFLQNEGHKVTRIAPDSNGRTDPAKFAAEIDSGTALVTVIHAQNEIGTIQPIADISVAARKHGALMHADAAQSLGKISVDVNALGVDLLSIAGHKLYAPKGIGALYVRRGTKIPPLLLGAGQESCRRPGTENVAFIVALGEASRIAAIELENGHEHLASLSNALWERLKKSVPGIKLVGHPSERLPNTLNVLFPGVSGRLLLEACPGVLASNGSACHADSEEPSAILRAVGIPHAESLGAVRLSLGRQTAQDDIEAAASRLAAAWQALRQSEKVRAAG